MVLSVCKHWPGMKRCDVTILLTLLMCCAVQVLDARDPLRYRSEDMDEFARELHPGKASLMLLNKADLLTLPLRKAWADYFDARGVDYIFWSAKAASERPLNPGARLFSFWAPGALTKGVCSSHFCTGLH